MKIWITLLVLTLTGCGGLNGIVRDLNDSTAELMGTYSAPTLAGAPTPSDCNDQRCRTLDALEAKGYELARQGKITWVRLVDVFYQKRSELYPKSEDGFGANELKAYQRALAEQMDLGKIRESQWAYLIANKNAEINARNRILFNSTPRERNCTTTNIGTNDFPRYSTTCR
jgi:hypothetical protein